MTMINSYSVGIGLNADKLVQGGLLARKEITSLTSTMRSLITPAEKLTQKINLIDKALQTNTGDTAILNEAKSRLQQQIAKLESEMGKETAALHKQAEALQRVAKEEERLAKWKRDREQGLARQAWLNAPDKQAEQGRKDLQARLAAFKKQKQIEQDMLWKGEGFDNKPGRQGGMMQSSTARGGMGGIRADGLLQASYMIDDAQYGLRGVVNNIAPLVQGLGGSAKLAGGLSILAVGVNVLSKATQSGTYENEKLTASLENLKGTLADLTDNSLMRAADSIQNVVTDAAIGGVHKMTQGFRWMGAAVGDLLSGDTGFTRFNKVLDDYKRKQEEIDAAEQKAHNDKYGVKRIDMAALALQRLNEEHDRHFNFVSHMAEMQKPYADYMSNWQSSFEQQLGGLRSNLLSERVGANEAGLIEQARKAVQDRFDLGALNGEQRLEMGRLAEKYAKGEIESYKEYAGLLERSQYLQLNSLEVAQRKIDKERQLKQAKEQQLRVDEQMIQQQRQQYEAMRQQAEQRRQQAIETASRGIESVQTGGIDAYRKITEIENRKAGAIVGDKLEKQQLDLDKKHLRALEENTKALTRKKGEIVGV